MAFNKALASNWPGCTGGNVGISAGAVYQIAIHFERQLLWRTHAVAVGGHAYSIPAMDCYVNTMDGPTDGTGAVLSFSASACYPTSGSTGPGTPLNPNAIVVPGS